MEKYLGLDLGTTTLGIATNDYLGFVHGVETFRFDRNQYIVARKHVLELCEKMMINKLVIGLPMHLNNTPSEMSENVLRFKEDLLKANPNLQIELCDERLSTVSAHRSLTELNVNHKQRKDSVDRIAACIILDTYLAMKGNR